MVAGLAYNPIDEELVNLRKRAKDLCFKYNNTLPSLEATKKEIINELIPDNKGSFHIEPSFWCDYGLNIHLGENFYSNHNLVILDVADVIIGNNVLFGPNVAIYTAYHPLDEKTRISGIEYGKKIVIEDNVWVGGNSIILPGVTIKKGAIIGAGAVVTKDVSENTTVVGNKARPLIRKTNNEI